MLGKNLTKEQLKEMEAQKISFKDFLKNDTVEVAAVFEVMRDLYTSSEDSAALLTVAHYLKKSQAKPAEPVKRGPGRPPKNVD